MSTLLKPPSAISERMRLAIAELTARELLKLEGYAKKRIKCLGAKALGRGGDDLLEEAVFATLAGHRTWKLGIPFPKHLLLIIRSISSNWARTRLLEVLESDLFQGSADGHGGLEERIVDGSDPQRDLERREQLKAIEGAIARDPQLVGLYSGLRDGLTDEEIAVELGIEASDLQAAKKRMRRLLRTLEGGKNA